MSMNLTTDFEEAIRPVLDALPFEMALRRLVVDGPSEHTEASAAVAKAIQDPAVAERPDLIAGLWMYVDELDKSHEASQDLNTPTGSYWHAIMHRREGDFSNSKYWLSRAVHHPAMGLIDLTGGGAGSGTAVAAYDAVDFVDRVQRAHEREDGFHPELVSAQCKEWKALFEWCIHQ
ncbi:hypothetical protein HNQ40_001766 [Algisphaera agarilytica]|uniref:Uncharacterized protein n=2 Tax=Algisphaera agarilytica TaxID=1385975 RepID=A0A7X0LK13_9BACT|nr:hypothetical protein [Algisphaera agarilytica]